MPTSLTLETSHGYDGELVLKATGEIDLSNIDAFDVQGTLSSPAPGQYLADLFMRYLRLATLDLEPAV